MVIPLMIIHIQNLIGLLFEMFEYEYVYLSLHSLFSLWVGKVTVAALIGGGLKKH